MKEMQKQYEIIDFPPLSESEKKQIANLKNLRDNDIDTSDIPEQTGDGQFYYFSSLKMAKKDIHTKIDIDNLEWLKKDGKGYQGRLNNVIRWARMNGCPIGIL